MPRFKRYNYTRWAEATLTQLKHDKPDVLAVDTETSGLAFHDEAFCVTLSWRDQRGQLHNAYVDTEDKRRLQIVEEALLIPSVLVFHNAKFDLQKLDYLCLLPPTFNAEDTQTIFNLLDENGRKALKVLARDILGEETNEEEKLKKVRKKMGLTKEDGYYHLPREVIIPYAMKDTEFTLRLYEILKPRLEAVIAKDPAVADVYREELEVSEVLREMESVGFQLDMKYLTQTAGEYELRVMNGWADIVKMVGNEEFNPNSPMQVKAAFAAQGVTLADTQAVTLRRLDHPFAKALLSYRSDAKMHGTYLRGLLAEQVEGVVHPWFNPTGARTGRMSSGGAQA